MINILIAEDQSLLRGALATLLELEEDFHIAATASGAKEAEALMRSIPVDILVTDIEMPGKSGIELAAYAREHFPNIKTMIVTTFARPGYFERAMKAGVSGYILKDAPADELADALRRVATGQTVFSAELNRSAWNSFDPLNDREREILRLAEAGKTNKEIAASLNLSAGTIRNYLADVTQKLDASNRIEAFRIARENGWL